MEQQALTCFLKLIEHKKLIASFPTKGSILHKRLVTEKFSPTTQFLANFETWTLLKRTIQIIETYLAADWRLKKHFPKWSFPNHCLQEKKTSNICSIYGIMRICAQIKTFYAGPTTKTLSQHSKQCKKCLIFITRKDLTCWVLVVHLRIWQIFAPRIYKCQILSIRWNR